MNALIIQFSSFCDRSGRMHKLFFNFLQFNKSNSRLNSKTLLELECAHHLLKSIFRLVTNRSKTQWGVKAVAKSKSTF